MNTSETKTEIKLPSFMKEGFSFRLSNYATVKVTTLSVIHNNLGVQIKYDKQGKEPEHTNWNLSETIEKFNTGIYKIDLSVLPKKKVKPEHPRRNKAKDSTDRARRR